MFSFKQIFAELLNYENDKKNYQLFQQKVLSLNIFTGGFFIKMSVIFNNRDKAIS